MSNSLALATIAGGCCFGIYGGYQYIQAVRSNPETEVEKKTVDEQKRSALYKIAAGVGLVATGTMLLDTLPLTGILDDFFQKRQFENLMSKYIKEERETCHLEELLAGEEDEIFIAKAVKKEIPAIYKAVQVLRETRGVSCENYFTSGDSVSWEINEELSPAINVFYSCNGGEPAHVQLTEGPSKALTTLGDIRNGGINTLSKDEHCVLNPSNFHSDAEFYSTLRKLFSTGVAEIKKEFAVFFNGETRSSAWAEEVTKLTLV